MFTLDPDLAVFKDFLFPNRHRAFEFADGPFAGFKGGPTMRGADANYYAGLANLQTAGAVDDTNVRDLKFLTRLRAQLFHLGNGHRRIRFVDQVKRATALGPLASITVQSHGRPALRQDDATCDGTHLDGIGG